MLSEREVETIVFRMTKLPINSCPTPKDDAKKRLWDDYLKSVDPADSLLYGTYTDSYVYSKVHSIFVACKTALRLALGNDLDTCIKECWYEQPYRRDIREKRSFGQMMEPRAITLYSQKTGNIVKQCKHVVNPMVPFLIVSPDGLVFRKGAFDRAIEIKTVTDIHSLDKLHELRCCRVSCGRLVLKKHVPMYAQLQFTMLALNLDIMDLVLYFPSFNHVEVVVVHRDAGFLNHHLPNLYKNYTHHVMPHILSKLGQI